MVNNSSTFKMVRECFSAPDYEATPVGNKPILNFKFEERFDGGRDEEWKAQIVVSEYAFFKKIALFSFVPFKISENKQEEVVELLNRINYAEDIGSFEMSYDTGRVRCKTSIQITEDNLSSDVIIGIVEANTDLMGKYLPIIDQVSKGELLPMDAIDDDDYDNYD